MAKEYIPREDVINDIGELFTICRETYPNECGHHFIVEGELQIHLDHVRNLPAADVRPVVRCSECKHNTSSPHNPICEYGNRCYCGFFCADGERKDGDGE